MARLARVVIPGIPHYITQRGNRQQQVFSGDADYQLYLDLVAAGCAKAGVEVWAYCLMPGHVHLIAVPQDQDGLRPFPWMSVMRWRRPGLSSAARLRLEWSGRRKITAGAALPRIFWAGAIRW